MSGKTKIVPIPAPAPPKPGPPPAPSQNIVHTEPRPKHLTTQPNNQYQMGKYSLLTLCHTHLFGFMAIVKAHS